MLSSYEFRIASGVGTSAVSVLSREDFPCQDCVQSFILPDFPRMGKAIARFCRSEMITGVYYGRALAYSSVNTIWKIE